ncbi:hypothetical protein BASA61_008084 [Batrachochytrium salamandrivorans]|nr:hypothetical protein BASA61_008084 [Batrachochytrium salamandrivorans]
MSLFHFNIPISTNGLFHNPISTNSSITSSNINRSIPNTQSLHTSITSTPTTIPITPTISEIRHQRSKYALERTFQVWGKSKLACSYVQANHASSAKFLRSPALSTGQAIGASLLSLARCDGLWDYPRALKAGLLHPTATDPDQLGSPSLCILCHSHLECRPMAHLVTRVSSRQSALLTRKFPAGPGHSGRKTPLAAGPPPQTPTRLLLAAHPPRPISLLGRVFLCAPWGEPSGTNTAGNTEAYPGQQWLTGTVEEGNLLDVQQPVAHRLCDFLQISVRVYRAMLWKHHKSNLSHIPDI